MLFAELLIVGEKRHARKRLLENRFFKIYQFSFSAMRRPLLDP
jgi:hypothetical protein